LVPEGSRRRLARELAALAVDPIVGCFSMGENLDFEAPPPVKVIYLAHLPERLRMLAASLILSEVYRWMMHVGGCGRPRLAVVFDEVRGYLLPEKPSRKGSSYDAGEAGEGLRRFGAAGDAEP
ncbi:MAG: hypothetical protein QXG57_06665, partial [Thermofilaceae archaeon]